MQLDLVNASQSSTYSNKYPASKAFDGGLAFIYKEGEKSCSHTLNDLNPWWMGELAAPHYITRISVYPRIEGDFQKVYTKVTVSVSVDGQTWTLCRDLGDKLVKTKGWVDAVCPARTFGRFVNITQHNNHALVVCEVEIWGYGGKYSTLINDLTTT